MLALVAVGTAGAPGAHAGTDFVAGQAQASGAVVAVVAQAGGAQLPVTVGLATAQFRSNTGTAEATTLDLGLIGAVLTLSICGADPLLRADQLPQPLHADSTTDHAPKARTVADGGVALAGGERAEARPGAFASSQATPSALQIPAVLSVSGTSHAQTELVPGKERRAHATADLGDVNLLGGLVQLHGMHWQADQTTGPDGRPTLRRGAFTIGSVVVGGTALPTADAAQLSSALSLVNAVLGPLALTVQAPATTVGDDGSVVVSPLRIRVSGGSTAQVLLAPLLANGQATQARRAVANALLFGGCQPGVKGTPLQQLGGGANTVADVLLAGVAGEGGVALELGGARAESDDKTGANAFDSVLPFGAVPPGAAATSGAAASTAVGPAPVGPPLPIAAAPAPVAARGPVANLAAGVRCLTSAGRSASCARGRGSLAAGLAALLAAGLVALDVVRSRRTRPKPEESVS
jgi:hypothetical protein